MTANTKTKTVMSLATAMMLTLAALVCLSNATVAIPRCDQPGQISNSYILTFRQSTDVEAVTARSARSPQTQSVNGGEASCQVNHVYQKALKGMAIKVNSEAEAAEFIRSTIGEENVVRIECDQRVESSAVQANPPSWGLDRIDQRNLPFDNQYEADNQAQDVTVYVLDSGIDVTHPDFEGRATWGINPLMDGFDYDCHGHGTHVAGTIGSKTYGVAKKAQLVAVKVLGCNNQGTWAASLAGIDWVTTQCQANPTRRCVVNMSLTGGYIQSVNDAVTASVNSGVTYAVAAGNDNGLDACLFSPASTPAAITVAAADSNDYRSGYSNVGPCVDIYAPGTDIVSTHLGGSSRPMTGTSMASPHVAGVAALYLQQHPTATSAEVATWIVNNATPNVIINNDSNTVNKLLYSRMTFGSCPYTTCTSTYCYKLSAAVANESAGRNACISEGMQLANIVGASEFVGVASFLQQPAWINSWNNDDYASDCITMLPGGSITSPSCSASYLALCQILRPGNC